MPRKARTTGCERSWTFPASVVEWWIASPSSNCQLCRTTAERRRSIRSGFVNARAEDYWTLRERFEQGEVDIDPDDDKLAAFAGRANAAPMNVESHAGESITGDLMTKAW